MAGFGRLNAWSYREDAMPRAKGLTLGVEAGLENYGRRTQA